MLHCLPGMRGEELAHGAGWDGAGQWRKSAGGAKKRVNRLIYGFPYVFLASGDGHRSANGGTKVDPGGLQSILWKKKHPHSMTFE